MMVYGTLKKGFRNHHLAAPYCLSIETVQFWGRLYDLPAHACPAIEFFRSGLKGSPDYNRDSRDFARILKTEKLMSRELFLERPAGDWDLLEGELITLKEGEVILPVLDELESCFVDEKLCYDRVIIPVLTGKKDVSLAWAYQIRELPAEALRSTLPNWHPQIRK